MGCGWVSGVGGEFRGLGGLTRPVCCGCFGFEFVCLGLAFGVTCCVWV